MNLIKNTWMLFLVLVMLLAGASAETAFTPLGMEETAGRPPLEDSYLPDMGGYEDPSLKVTIETLREHETNILVARVKIADPSQIRTAMAARYGSTGTVLPDRFAKRVNAVLAVNGDFFSFNSTGYLVRQGKRYRDKTHTPSDILMIDDKGDFTIIVDPTEEKVKSFPGTIVNSFNFGPALVVDGEIAVTPQDEVGKAMADNPRTAIGVYAPGHYVLLVSDGRTRESEGLTLFELASFMQGLGVQTAYNLDGGGSSTMVFMGTVVNNPTTNGRRITERSVSDIVYVGY